MTSLMHSGLVTQLPPMVYKQTLAAPNIIKCCASSNDDLVLSTLLLLQATAAGDYTSADPLRSTSAPLQLFQFRSSHVPFQSRPGAQRPLSTCKPAACLI